MAISSARFVPYEMKTSVIKIISYENKNLRGVLINPYFEKEMYFDNVIQLIIMIDGMLNDLRYPQRGTESRSLKTETAESEKVPPAQREIETEEVLASFKVNILFRQNASWQGNIVWMEKELESSFRSVLEFIMLIDSVLTD